MNWVEIMSQMIDAAHIQGDVPVIVRVGDHEGTVAKIKVRGGKHPAIIIEAKDRPNAQS